jgi:radical SAM protein with 4Fe4S-binding SPASM domain
VTDCLHPTWRESGPEEFRRLLLRREQPDDLPLNASFEVTHRCNLACRHCYLQCGRQAPAPELSTADARRLIDRLADHGVLSLLFTGGEPFIRADFDRLCRHARRRGLLMHIFTNATLIDDNALAWLRDDPPQGIEVSVYGHTPVTYEQITGVPGSHAAFRRGLARLLTAGLPVTLKMPVMRSNRAEYDAVRRWCSEELGRPFRYDVFLSPALNHSPAVLDERLPPADAARLACPAPTTTEEFHAKAQATESAPADPRLFRCGAGRLSFALDPGGHVLPCLMWRSDPYDLLHGSVAEWKARMAELHHRPAPADAQCGVCRYRITCPTCPAVSALLTGEAGRHVDYFCLVCETENELIFPTHRR